jgi:hypothetical protein
LTEFCSTHWRHVIYTDKSRFLLHRSDGRVRVRRQQCERFREDCVVGTVMAGGCSVHVWGGIHHGGKTDLVVLQNSVNGDRYRQLLQTELILKAPAEQTSVYSCSWKSNINSILPQLSEN